MARRDALRAARNDADTMTVLQQTGCEIATEKSSDAGQENVFSFDHGKTALNQLRWRSRGGAVLSRIQPAIVAYDLRSVGLSDVV